MSKTKAPVPPVRAQFNNASGARPVPPPTPPRVPDAIKKHAPKHIVKPPKLVRGAVDTQVREQAAINHSKHRAAGQKRASPKLTRKAEFNAKAKGVSHQFNRASRGR